MINGQLKSDEADPNFLLTLLNSNGIKNLISGKVIGAAAPRVNVKDLKGLLLIKPPVEVQQKYGAIVVFCQNIRKKLQEYLKLSSLSFTSRTQRAFRGELQ